MIGRLRRGVAFSVLPLFAACSTTRPVPVAFDAPSLRTYLAEHPAANLRVTERSGRRYWIHSPTVRGDSLVGRRGYDLPIRPLGVPLTDLSELRTGHFSYGRTGAVTLGVMAAALVTIGLLVEEPSPLD